ncbi:hypothetical protein A2W45_01140 [Candidatus Curtissbacteria bacterium RIFCSPHIGHO2_12_41_11]|uniref:Uncharacterized protein n=3 Tax=Candidatus Curtissiibacteriota TaxID=1752717 RepID=A0A1F5HS11_9BACT|nr:MAG: hypothetical protein UU56_C0022G0011 [Candidatus Curtissbacteria bacterium GW2011_GWA2_41_24]OGD99351.1 MAG: hypothetical protein A2W45_01140 [Candidatus Curtissbacteria bacterium RIFCSPHIGHO2_12_41_11]OGE06873.1 MAG: hypothetical protein A2W70_01590 [Candidatus Curtissbacteria bacterium RIFCSPLOWO2_02_41_11]
MERARQSAVTPELRPLHRASAVRIERIVARTWITPAAVKERIGYVSFEGFKVDGRFIIPSWIQTIGHRRKYNLELNPYNPYEPDTEDPQGEYKVPLRHKVQYWFDKNGSAGKFHFLVPVNPLADVKDWPQQNDFSRLLGEEINQDTTLSGGDYENIAYILNQLEERLQISGRPHPN